MIILDDWQKEFIAYKGDKILVAGRQTGKSEAQAYDNAEFAAENPGTNSLLISKTQRQSEELLIKTLLYLQDRYPKRIGKGKFKPLKYSVWVMPEKKGDKPSRVMCQPTGLAGEGIRSYTIHKLSADEAQLIPEAVFTAVTPMLLTTGGHISMTGTPQGRKGFFYKAYENKLNQFKVFHVNSETVIKNRPISASWPQYRRESALLHLEREKKRMTAKQYAQEYEGQFVEDLEQLFSDAIIERIFRGKRKFTLGRNYLGCDIGRSYDPSVFTIIDGDSMKQLENHVIKELTITQNAAKVKQLSQQWKTYKDGIDGGGLGSGVVDILMDDKKQRKKTVDLNNASRVVEFDYNNPKEKKLLKEQMYLNLLHLMEEDKCVLLDDDEIKQSFRSVQIEFKEASKDVEIFGSDTHCAEAAVRAYWLAVKNKRLKLWIR